MHNQVVGTTCGQEPRLEAQPWCRTRSMLSTAFLFSAGRRSSGMVTRIAPSAVTIVSGAGITNISVLPPFSAGRGLPAACQTHESMDEGCPYNPAHVSVEQPRKVLRTLPGYQHWYCGHDRSVHRIIAEDRCHTCIKLHVWGNRQTPFIDPAAVASSVSSM